MKFKIGDKVVHIKDKEKQVWTICRRPKRQCWMDDIPKGAVWLKAPITGRVGWNIPDRLQYAEVEQNKVLLKKAMGVK